MATGYRLEAGYNSGHNKAEVWRQMKLVALGICAAPERIVAEVRRVEGGGLELQEYADAYRHHDDLTVVFHETPAGYEKAEEFRPYIHQMASGGGRGRTLKEACRRAFCRLVIEAMHRMGMEVTLVVS